MYNLIYIIVIIIMILIGNYNFIIKKENKFVLYFLIFIFSITVGIRELSIPDTRAYYNMFKEINTNILEINYSYFEFGFIVISKIIKNLTTNVRVYFGLISVINLLLIIKVFNLLKLNKVLSLGMIIYFSYYGIYYNMIVLRLGLACSFLMLSIVYLEKNKKINSLILFICSYFFHKSVIYSGLIFIISKKKLKVKQYFFIILLIGIVYYGQLGKYFLKECLDGYVKTYINYFPFENRYLIYIDNFLESFSENKFEYSFKFLLNYILVIFILIENKYNFFYLNIVLLGLSIFAFFNNFIAVERVSDLYIMFNIINIIQNLNDRKFKIKKYFLLNIVIILNFILITRILKIF